MVKVVFETHKGVVHEIESEEGHSVMQTAIDNMVPGILGDCGGACACATCHVYVDPTWWDRLEPPGEGELSMLENAVDPGETSRLCCQIKLAPALDGLKVKIPASQF